MKDICNSSCTFLLKKEWGYNCTVHQVVHCCTGRWFMRIFICVIFNTSNPFTPWVYVMTEDIYTCFLLCLYACCAFLTRFSSVISDCICISHTCKWVTFTIFNWLSHTKIVSFKPIQVTSFNKSSFPDF